MVVVKIGDAFAAAAEIVLTDAERAELVGWTRRRKSAAGLALRARFVLAAAEWKQRRIGRPAGSGSKYVLQVAQPVRAIAPRRPA